MRRPATTAASRPGPPRAGERLSAATTHHRDQRDATEERRYGQGVVATRYPRRTRAASRLAGCIRRRRGRVARGQRRRRPGCGHTRENALTARADAAQLRAGARHAVGRDARFARLLGVARREVAHVEPIGAGRRCVPEIEARVVETGVVGPGRCGRKNGERRDHQRECAFHRPRRYHPFRRRDDLPHFAVRQRGTLGV